VGGAASTPSGVTLGTGVGSVSNTAVGTGALGGIGYLWQTSTTALKAEINALEQLGLTKVVSNPKLFTMDNEEAVIIDGTQIPYPVAGVGANQITYEFKDAALKLTVTPTIIGDGNIYLNMVLNKDSPNYATTPPSIDKRELRNRLLVQDGTIAVVGGIYTQTNANNINKTPGLADIPLLGALFRDTQWQNNRRELLVYISTRILD
jgi:type IV pilus assembly protein PilQ